MTGTAINITGLEAVRDTLAKVAERASDLTPAMRDIGIDLVKSTQLRFESETDPTGRPWRPLSVETIIRRLGGRGKAFKTDRKGNTNWRKPAERQIGMMKILQAAGHLKQSITTRAGRDQVEVGSNLVYARIHQFGGKAGRGRKVTIPPRPFLGIDRGDQDMILSVLRGFIQGVA